jgi:hypothetical protein
MQAHISLVVSQMLLHEMMMDVKVGKLSPAVNVTKRVYRITANTDYNNIKIEYNQHLLKEGSGVCQKHNCLGFVFIAAIVTTCFGCAWPSSGHNVDVMHK